MCIPIEEKIAAELIFDSLKTMQLFSQNGRTDHLQGSCAVVAKLICIGLYRSLQSPSQRKQDVTKWAAKEKTENICEKTQYSCSRLINHLVSM